MPLDDLVSVIETLQLRIQDHGDSLRQDETRTRMALIDPLLQALGWDPSDPSLVTPEYNVSGKRADYALLGDEGAPVVFLEAKRLSESIPNHRSQVVAYASELGIRYPALTNGSDWEVYDNTILKPIEERSILRLSINGSPAYQLALQLLLLWRPNLASGQPIQANEPMLASQSQPTPAQESQETVIQSPSPPAQHQVSPSVMQGWVLLSDFIAVTGANHPASIRFPDGKECSIQRWRDMVDHTVAWLWSKSLLKVSNIPVASSNKRYIVSAEDKHPTGNSFNQPVHIKGTPLIIEGNISSKAATANTKTLLKHFGQDPAAIWLKLN
jgi:hypothetical protein